MFCWEHFGSCWWVGNGVYEREPGPGCIYYLVLFVNSNNENKKDLKREQAEEEWIN